MDPEQGKRRADVLASASRSLTELVADPVIRPLFESPQLPEPDGYLAWVRGHGDPTWASLRLCKRAALAQIAAFDLAGDVPLERAMTALSDLADACLQAALERLDPDGDLSVIAMGKLGARELNYVSDIDLMFVSEGDPERATKVATELLSVLGEHSPQGRAYEIDLNLRPEGRSGALVRSLDGYLEYYKRWAQQWEFQALLKARACAGNRELGDRFVESTRDFVFPPTITAERVAAIRKMKERVEEHAARPSLRSKGGDASDVKLGPGGIRDVEFSIQLLQLVHGSSDPAVRHPRTLDALAALVEAGYVAEEDGAGLSVAYRWLRNVEHRLQLWQERRIRHLPNDEEGSTRLAHAMGFKDNPTQSASDRFKEAHSGVLSDVRGRFERLFYRPMVESLAEGMGARLSEAAIEERLAVLGFRDVKRAARTLEGLVTGTSRRARLLRVLTPTLLRSLASTPLPDEGLFAFLRLGEALEGRLDTLGALRDNPPGIAFLAQVLGSGKLLGEVLNHVPEELATIADPEGAGPLKDRDRLVREAGASLGWREPEKRLDGLRRFKRREMLRVGLADLAGEGSERVGEALADLADACLEAALGEPQLPFAVIGMGKLGGRELNYSSDIDVMFVHDADPMQAERLAESLMKAIGEVTPEGQAFRIDAALRPEGKSGPLARSLGSFAEYYARWAEPWEFQALIKARLAAGDPGVGERFLTAAQELAWPAKLDDKALTQMRHLKARMEKERIPRGTDPRRHLKMGPGGLADVEFTIQTIQRRLGGAVEELRERNTLAAIEAAQRAGELDEGDAGVLSETYRFLMRLRNRAFFLYGRPVDVLPVKPEELEALGIAVGLRDQPRQELEETYLRVTRRCRKVAKRVIFGD